MDGWKRMALCVVVVQTGRRGYWARGEDQPVFGRNRIWKAFVRLYRMGCFVWRDEEEVVGFMDWMWRWMGVIGMDGSDGCVGCCVGLCVVVVSGVVCAVCVCCVLSVCLYKRSQLPLMNPNPHTHTTHPPHPSTHTPTHTHTHHHHHTTPNPPPIPNPPTTLTPQQQHPTTQQHQPHRPKQSMVLPLARLPA